MATATIEASIRPAVYGHLANKKEWQDSIFVFTDNDQW